MSGEEESLGQRLLEAAFAYYWGGRRILEARGVTLAEAVRRAAAASPEGAVVLAFTREPNPVLPLDSAVLVKVSRGVVEAVAVVSPEPTVAVGEEAARLLAEEGLGEATVDAYVFEPLPSASTVWGSVEAPPV